jgi:hypothetical protein
MSSTDEKIAFLTEHLSYEVVMLRYTHTQLARDIHHQLQWNALFESFALHASNLYDFFTNDKDARNFKARDFAISFQAKQKEKVRGTINSINSQVLHLNKSSESEGARKVNIDRSDEVFRWIEENVVSFANDLLGQILC